MESNEARPSAFLDEAARVATWVILGVVPIVCAGFFLVASYVHDSLAYDFRNAYLPASEAVLDGASPYVDVDDPRLAAETAYVYPPPLAYALTPLTGLTDDAASAVIALLSLALVGGTLLVLGVRDWRCFGVSLVWAPVLIGVHTGSSSLVIAFAIALVWRCRESVSRAGGSLGLAIAVKLLVWPLVVWMLVTRRVAAALAATGVGAVIVLGSWAALGFEDFGRYPNLLRRLADLESSESYSLVAFAGALGLGESVGQLLSVAVGGALLVACVAFGRLGDDFRSFTSAIAAALASTPIFWQHYLVLLLVPLAVARRRFSAIWLVPVLLWLAPREDNGAPLQTLLPALAAAVLVAYLLRARVATTKREPLPAR